MRPVWEDDDTERAHEKRKKWEGEKNGRKRVVTREEIETKISWPTLH